ncbi:mycoredoxin [Mycetocola reblochoni]|uniref:POSSIBLE GLUTAREDOXIN PROTEIN n=2 Tax=Mycetocola reblochoni TaxID=331618 RepID=A0A1R4K8D2_9MICO|nr:mycoredoxin [Mycetocola reblochoni]RLP68074.1 mycoredoxin [Mycetocola reblochoni]SJN40580.1 POSSIBLE GLUTAREDOXIN PROTEIN [Mycetocola reblochoni REB411]
MSAADIDQAKTRALPSTGEVTVFSTPWCGYCQRLTAQMDRAGVAYRTIDIEQHPDAAALVESVNGGNQTVPTLLFADGTALTNPSLHEVQQRIAAG